MKGFHIVGIDIVSGNRFVFSGGKPGRKLMFRTRDEAEKVCEQLIADPETAQRVMALEVVEVQWDLTVN